MHENVSKEVLCSYSRNFSKLCDFLSSTLPGTKWWPFLQLAGANRPIALANANAILRRVELVCEVGHFVLLQNCFLFLESSDLCSCLYTAE
jgi:hypothetical protein